MIQSLQKQPRIESLAPLSIDRNFALKETDLNEIVRTVESWFPVFWAAMGILTYA